MARPQQYNREQALNDAMQLFWTQGYEATNLPQLLNRTGLCRSSFYTTFGDKRQLYLEALEHYANRLIDRLKKVSESDDPKTAIYYYYANAIEPPKSHRPQNGCLLINTIIEFESMDDELYKKALNYGKKIDHAFEQCFQRAHKVGKLRADIDLKLAVKLLGTIGCGIQVRRRSRMSPKDIKCMLDMYIDSICVNHI
jgi:TetR/AcrR family transcriptional repressor of nem operon